MAEELNLLFLGAGKRLSLFERIADACRREGYIPNLHSYENSTQVPVAAMANIVVGMRWDSPNCGEHLLSTIAKHNITVVVPCMDEATLLLSKYAGEVKTLNCWPVVSSENICVTFENKKLSEQWFLNNNVRVPIWQPDSPFPWILKRVHGFAARGQLIVRSQQEFQDLQHSIRWKEYMIQPFVDGPEFTVDAYVDKTGSILGCVTRRRIRVVDGEVVDSVTEYQPVLIQESIRILSKGKFVGPITLQAIESGGQYWFIEINPRFGGGVILSMEAGADYARLLVREAVGRPVAPVDWRPGVLMTRTHREVFHEGNKHGYRS